MGKKSLPEITDKLTNHIEREIINWEFEWKKPSENSCSIWNWYQINTNWIVIWKDGSPMKYVSRKWKRSPFVIIKKKQKDENWNIISKDKEIRIDWLMKKYFWQYIKWYSDTKIRTDKEFIIVPKNWEWNNMAIDNLEFVEEKKYNLIWTKKYILTELMVFLKNKNDQEFADMLWVSIWRVNRIRSELKEQWKIWNEILNDLIISHKTYPIYVALLNCKWLKSNLDISKELWSNEDFSNKIKQEELTNKISRVRKKLYDKWIIEKYNTYQQTVNISDVKEKLGKTLLENKNLEKNKRKTHLEIAQMFGLKKEQVDNFSRKFKKE
jgi:hypothetical protein